MPQLFNNKIDFQPLNNNTDLPEGFEIDNQNSDNAILNGFGKRVDGTNKGSGFLGVLKRPDGGVSTEISIGVNINGKEMEIPTLVPTLNKDEIDSLLRGDKPSRDIVNKAIEHANKRLSEGKSVFYEGDSSEIPEGFQIEDTQSSADLPSGFEIEQDAANAVISSDTGIRGLIAGAASTVEAGGYLLDLIAQDSPIGKASKDLEKLTGVPTKDNPLVAFGKDVKNKVPMLPTDSPLYYKIASAIGSSLPTMLPGVGVAGAMVKGGASIAKASTVASAVSATLESGLEAGGVAGQLKEEGKSKEDINNRAAFTFAANLPLLFVTDKLGGLFDLGKGNVIMKAGKTAFLEGGQEGGQQAISNVATDKPIGQDVGEAALLGGIVGGSMSGVIQLATNIDSRAYREKVYQQFKQDVDTGVIEFYDENGNQLDITDKERQIFDKIVAEAEKNIPQHPTVADSQPAQSPAAATQPSEEVASTLGTGPLASDIESIMGKLKQQGATNEEVKGQEANQEMLVGAKYKLSEYEQKMKEFNSKAVYPEVGSEVKVNGIGYKVTKIKAGKTGDMVEASDLGGRKYLFALGQIDEKAKYKSSEEEAAINKAKEHFGITNDINEAGYLLPSGEMLDFSGRHEAVGYEGGKVIKGKPDYLRGQRNVDHRQIQDIIDIKDNRNAMHDFVNLGNIRLQPNGIELSKSPTQKQFNVIKQHILNNRGESFFVDIVDSEGFIRKSISLEYPNVSVSKIIDAIKEKLPEVEGLYKKQQPSWEELKKDKQEIERLDKEGKELIKKLLPEMLDTFENVPYLYTKEGKKALGVYVGGKIKVVSGQGINVYIHEIGHAIFDMFLTPQEKSDLLMATKAKYDTTSDKLAEEYLMEDLEKYAKRREEMKKPPTLLNKIEELFEKIFRAVKKFLGMNRDNVKDFYEDILSGGFRKYKKPNRYSLDAKYSTDTFDKWIDTNLKKRIIKAEDRANELEVNKAMLAATEDVNNLVRRRINKSKNPDILEEIKEFPKEVFTSNPYALSADEALDEVNNSGLVKFNDLREMTQFYQRSFDEEKNLRDKVSKLKPQLVTRKDTTILKQDIAMAKRGYSRGVSDTVVKWKNDRSELIKNLKSLFANKAEARENILKDLKKYVSENVEPKDRSRFIPLIINSKTPAQISEAFRRIDEYVQNKAKRSAAQEVSALIDDLLESPNIGVEYKKAIKNLVSDVDLVNRRPDTIRKIIELQESIDKRKAKGEDVYLAQNVVNRLALLSKVPFKDITLLDMEGLYQQLKDLGSEAERAVMDRRNAYELEKAGYKAAVIENAKPIESIKSKVRSADKAFDYKNNPFTEFFIKVYNASKYTDLSLSPMNVVFDMLDGGGATYDGKVYQSLKRPIDLAYSRYLNTRDKFLIPIINKVKELNINEKSLNRIGIYAISKQEGGIDRLIQSGLTVEEIKSVELNEKERDFYNSIRDGFNKIYPTLTDAMMNIYNKEVGFVKNYSPFMKDSAQWVNEEIDARFIANKNSVSHGMAEERSEAAPQNRPLNLNILDVYTAYADNVAYLVEMGRPAKMLGEIVNDEDVKRSLGDLGAQALREYADLIARKGGSAGAIQMKAIDTLKRNLSIGVFGLKLSSALIQTSSVLNAGIKIGRYSIHGLTEYLGNKDIRSFVFDNMPEVRNRIGDDPAYLEKFAGKKMESLRQFSLWAMTANDKISAGGVAWGAYLYSLKQQGKQLDLNNPDQTAIEFAQKVVVQTQSTSQFKDLPLSLSYGRLFKGKNKATGSEVRLISFERAFNQFQSYMLVSQWSPLRYDFIENIKKKAYDKAWQIAMYITLGSIATVGLKDLARIIGRAVTGFEPDEKDKERESFMNDLGREALQKIPFVSQMASLAMYSQLPVPALETAKDLFTGVGKLVKAKETPTKLKATADVVGSGLAIAGLPSAQATIVAKELIDRNDPKRIKNNIEEDYYKSKDKSILDKAVKDGIITTKQKLNIISSGNDSPLERKTKHMSYDEVILMIDKSKGDDKKELKRIAANKILNKIKKATLDEANALRKLRKEVLEK